MEQTTQSQMPKMQLGVDAREQLQMTQRLMMSAQMQQALHLLQVPLLELDAFLEEQIAANPALEWGEEERLPEEESEEREKEEPAEQELFLQEQDYTLLKYLAEECQDLVNDQEPSIPRSSEDEKKQTFLESSICAEKSLYEFLIEEIHQTFDQKEDQQIAEIVVGYLDQSGFLTTSLAEIAALHQINRDHLQRILIDIQTFEPHGIGAATIQESLLIQLRCLKKEKGLAYRVIQNHYQDLVHNRLPIIQKALQCTMEALREAIDQDIATLDLHPGLLYSSGVNPIIVPDVTLKQEGEALVIDVNHEHVHRLRLNTAYLKMLDNPEVSLETKDYIKKHILSAKWLMRNLHHRYSTIERIALYLAEKQRSFFMQPDGQLIPLTMKTVAEELQLHESTIARTVSNKYMESPRGLLPLRSFFTNGYLSEEGKDLSSQTIREALAKLIEQEDKTHPYSDEALSQLLKQQGMPCARRTVAKYRTEMSIGTTLQRKKFV